MKEKSLNKILTSKLYYISNSKIDIKNYGGTMENTKGKNCNLQIEKREKYLNLTRSVKEEICEP